MGEIPQDEANQLKDEIKTRSQTFKQRLDELVETRVEDMLKKLSLPAKSEIDALTARVEELTAQIDTLTEELSKEAVQE